MSHAIVRTNATGQPFRGRCIKCGEEDLRMSDGLKDCPDDEMVSDQDALLSILKSEKGKAVCSTCGEAVGFCGQC